MKNIRVYDCFLDNINKNFKIRYFMISLVRTFIHNFGRKNKAIYYRKRSNRKLSLIGKNRSFRAKAINLQNLDFEKMGIKNIEKLVSEYIATNNSSNTNIDFLFDIAKRDVEQSVIIDSILKNDDIVSMCFENNSKKKDNKIQNIYWINQNSHYDYFNYLSQQINV